MNKRNFELNSNEVVGQVDCVNHIISVQKICAVFMLLFLFCFSAFNFGKTNSFLSDSGSTMGIIKVSGTEINVYQDTGSGYEKVSSSGIKLGTARFCTDQTYSYDVKLKNDDRSTVVATSYYVRWKFIAKIDGTEYNINSYITTSDTKAYLNGEYYYYVDAGNNNKYMMAQEEVVIMGSMEFIGSYDSVNDSYGSLLDQKFSGSEFEFYLILEGQEATFGA